MAKYYKVCNFPGDQYVLWFAADAVFIVNEQGYWKCESPYRSKTEIEWLFLPDGYLKEISINEDEELAKWVVLCA